MNCPTGNAPFIFFFFYFKKNEEIELYKNYLLLSVSVPITIFKLHWSPNSASFLESSSMLKIIKNNLIFYQFKKETGYTHRFPLNLIIYCCNPTVQLLIILLVIMKSHFSIIIYSQKFIRIF